MRGMLRTPLPRFADCSAPALLRSAFALRSSSLNRLAWVILTIGTVEVDGRYSIISLRALRHRFSVHPFKPSCYMAIALEFHRTRRTSTVPTALIPAWLHVEPATRGPCLAAGHCR